MNNIKSNITPKNLKNTAVRGAGINVIAQLIGFFFHTGGVIIIARILSPTDFGLVAMVAVFSTWLMNFGLNGLSEFIIQKKELLDTEVNAVFWVHVIISLLFAVSFSALGFLLVIFYQEPTLNIIAAVMSTSFIFIALKTCHRALLIREMEFKTLAISELVALILSIFLSIALALIGAGYWAIVARQLTIPFLTMIAVWRISNWRPGLPRHLSEAIPAFIYAIKVYCNFTIAYLSKSIDKILIGKYHGTDSLGNYDRAYHLSSIPAGQLLGPLHSVALSALSRLQDNPIQFAAFYIRAVSLVAHIGTMLALCLTLSARDLLPFLLGPEWVEAGFIVMAFGPGIAAMLVYETHSWLHLSLGTPGNWMRWNIFAIFITIISFSIAAFHGAIAMAGAYSATKYILIIPGLWYAGIPIKLEVKVLLNAIWSFFLAGFIVAVLWLFLFDVYQPTQSIFMNFLPIIRICITLSIVPILYFLIICILQRSFNSIREIFSLLETFTFRR